MSASKYKKYYIIGGVIAGLAVAMYVAKKLIFDSTESTSKGDAQETAVDIIMTEAEKSPTQGGTQPQLPKGGRTISQAPIYDKPDNKTPVRWTIDRNQYVDITGQTVWFYKISYASKGGTFTGYVEKALIQKV